MFNELKIVKIVCLVLLLAFIIPRQLDIYKHTHFFLKPTSIHFDDSLKFFIASDASRSNCSVRVRDLVSNDLVLDTGISIKQTYNYFDTNITLESGYPSYQQVIKAPFTKPGIYLCNEFSPLILKSDSYSDITIVCPMVSNLFYTSTNNKRIFDSSSTFVSTNRKVGIDKWTLGLLQLFSRLEKQYTLNYVTDLDLEDKTVLATTKVIFLYGKSVFWSSKMIDNLTDFINDGGKVLTASSNLFHARFCADLKNNRLKTTDCSDFPNTEGLNIQTWRTTVEDSTMIFNKLHSDFGGKPLNSSQGLKIENRYHPIFKNLETEKKLSFLSVGYFTGAEFHLDATGKITLSENMKLLAYTRCEAKRKNEGFNVGGIIEYDVRNNGKVVSLGTSDWCLEQNQKLESTQLIFMNAFDYLVK